MTIMKPPTNPPQQRFSNSNIISRQHPTDLPAPVRQDQLERWVRRTGWILFAAITMIDLAVTFGPHIPMSARFLKTT
jgi:hypothetical protein